MDFLDQIIQEKSSAEPLSTTRKRVAAPDLREVNDEAIFVQTP